MFNIDLVIANLKDLPDDQAAAEKAARNYNRIGMPPDFRFRDAEHALRVIHVMEFVPSPCLSGAGRGFVGVCRSTAVDFAIPTIPSWRSCAPMRRILSGGDCRRRFASWHALLHSYGGVSMRYD